MSSNLPQVQVPTYFLEIPSTGEKIKFRPFLVKEEKLLTIAIQEKDLNVLLEAIEKMLTNCTFGAVDIKTLTSYDLEYILLEIRIKSKGHEVEVEYVCNNKVKNDDGSEGVCGEIQKVIIDLREAVITGEKELTKRIHLTDDIGICLKTPSFKEFYKFQEILKGTESKNTENISYDILPLFVEYIYQGETIFDKFTKDEIVDWIESLDDDLYSKIRDFFNNLSRLTLTKELVCPKCGAREVIVMEGLQSFLP